MSASKRETMSQEKKKKKKPQANTTKAKLDKSQVGFDAMSPAMRNMLSATMSSFFSKTSFENESLDNQQVLQQIQLKKQQLEDAHNHSMNICIAEMIVRDLIREREEKEFDDYFNKVGKTFSTKRILQFIDQTIPLVFIRNDPGDQIVYDYETDLQEPVPIKEKFGIEVFSSKDKKTISSQLSVSSSTRRAKKVVVNGRRMGKLLQVPNDESQSSWSFKGRKNSAQSSRSASPRQKERSENTDSVSHQKNATSRQFFKNQKALSLYGFQPNKLEDHIPTQIPIKQETPPKITEEDIKYDADVDNLKEYLRKKRIHDSIFKNTAQKIKSMAQQVTMQCGTVMTTDVPKDITTNDKGKPIRISHIKNYTKPLIATVEVNVPSSVANVIRDPAEIQRLQLEGKLPKHFSVIKSSGRSLNTQDEAQNKDAVPHSDEKKKSKKILVNDESVQQLAMQRFNTQLGQILHSQSITPMDMRSLTESNQNSKNLLSRQNSFENSNKILVDLQTERQKSSFLDISKTVPKRTSTKRLQQESKKTIHQYLDAMFLSRDSRTGSEEKREETQMTQVQQQLELNFSTKQPTVIYFDDPEALNILKHSKEEKIKDIQKEQELDYLTLNKHKKELEDENLKIEIKKMRKNTKRDCFSIIQDNQTRNPFMTNLAKSKEFKPSMGVLFKEDGADGEQVNGGPFKSNDPFAMTKEEFEMRQSITTLKSIGPKEKQQKRASRNLLSHSVDVTQLKTRPSVPKIAEDEGLSSIMFSSVSSRRNLSIKLPSIKVYNRTALKDMIMSEAEADEFNRSLDQSGPSPGIFTLASHRNKNSLKPDFSYRRVRIKSPLQMLDQQLKKNQQTESIETSFLQELNNSKTTDFGIKEKLTGNRVFNDQIYKSLHITSGQINMSNHEGDLWRPTKVRVNPRYESQTFLNQSDFKNPVSFSMNQSPLQSVKPSQRYLNSLHIQHQPLKHPSSLFTSQQHHQHHQHHHHHQQTSFLDILREEFVAFTSSSSAAQKQNQHGGSQQQHKEENHKIPN